MLLPSVLVRIAWLLLPILSLAQIDRGSGVNKDKLKIDYAEEPVDIDKLFWVDNPGCSSDQRQTLTKALENAQHIVEVAVQTIKDVRDPPENPVPGDIAFNNLKFFASFVLEMDDEDEQEEYATKTFQRRQGLQLKNADLVFGIRHSLDFDTEKDVLDAGQLPQLQRMEDMLQSLLDFFADGERDDRPYFACDKTVYDDDEQCDGTVVAPQIADDGPRRAMRASWLCPDTKNGRDIPPVMSSSNEADTARQVVTCPRFWTEGVPNTAYDLPDTDELDDPEEHKLADFIVFRAAWLLRELLHVATPGKSYPSYPYVKARNLQVEIPEGVNRISLIAKNPQWYSYLPNPDGPGQPWRADESTDKTVDVFKHTEPYMILCVACFYPDMNWLRGRQRLKFLDKDVRKRVMTIDAMDPSSADSDSESQSDDDSEMSDDSDFWSQGDDDPDEMDTTLDVPD